MINIGDTVEVRTDKGYVKFKVTKIYGERAYFDVLTGSSELLEVYNQLDNINRFDDEHSDAINVINVSRNM